MSIRIASRFARCPPASRPWRPTSPDAATLTVSALQSLFGELEGNAGAGGGFEEEIDDGLAAERRDLLDGALADFLERLGGVEDQRIWSALAIRARSGPCRGSASFSAPAPARRRRGRPARSTNTSTRSSGAALTALPTMSAWIGSSRPPRSISTQSSDAPRPAEVGALVQRGADGAAGVEHVVHDHDRRPSRSGSCVSTDDGAGTDGLEVVAIERDVELAAGNIIAFGVDR